MVKRRASEMVEFMPASKRQAKRLKAVTQKVNRLAGLMETKYNDIFSTFLNVAFDVNKVSFLSTISQGDLNQGNRIGAVISPTRIKIKGEVRSNATYATTIRIMLIRSKNRFVPTTDTNGTTSSIWTQGGNAGAVFGDVDWDNKGHFTILYDRTFSVMKGQDTNGIQFMIDQKLGGKIRYEGSTTNPENGALYMVATSSEATASSPPSLSYHSRLLYNDA